MRTLIALAIGFWVGRQIYINYDKQEARRKEAQVKKRVQELLENNGLTPSQAKEQVRKITGKQSPG